MPTYSEFPYDIATFATKLRETREARKLTRSEFARRAGVTPAAAWNWETQFTRPKPQTLSKIASILDVSESFLTGGADSGETGAPEAGAPELLRDIIETARQKIAIATRMPPNLLRISVEFLTG
jgi:transcriptional regulator with XRE-family HTH domain